MHLEPPLNPLDPGLILAWLGSSAPAHFKPASSLPRPLQADRRFHECSLGMHRGTCTHLHPAARAPPPCRPQTLLLMQHKQQQARKRAAVVSPSPTHWGSQLLLACCELMSGRPVHCSPAAAARVRGASRSLHSYCCYFYCCTHTVIHSARSAPISPSRGGAPTFGVRSKACTYAYALCAGDYGLRRGRQARLRHRPSPIRPVVASAHRPAVDAACTSCLQAKRAPSGSRPGLAVSRLSTRPARRRFTALLPPRRSVSPSLTMCPGCDLRGGRAAPDGWLVIRPRSRARLGGAWGTPEPQPKHALAVDAAWYCSLMTSRQPI
jgi:hypothetical protein